MTKTFYLDTLVLRLHMIRYWCRRAYNCIVSSLSANGNWFKLDCFDGAVSKKHDFATRQFGFEYRNIIYRITAGFGLPLCSMMENTVESYTYYGDIVLYWKVNLNHNKNDFILFNDFLAESFVIEYFSVKVESRNFHT